MSQSLTNFRPPSGIEVPAPEMTPPPSADETLPAIPGSPTLIPQRESDVEKMTVPQKSLSKKAKRKKSFVSTIFSRTGSKSEYGPGLAVIPSEHA